MSSSVAGIREFACDQSSLSCAVRAKNPSYVRCKLDQTAAGIPSTVSSSRAVAPVTAAFPLTISLIVFLGSFIC